MSLLICHLYGKELKYRWNIQSTILGNAHAQKKEVTAVKVFCQVRVWVITNASLPTSHEPVTDGRDKSDENGKVKFATKNKYQERQYPASETCMFEKY